MRRCALSGISATGSARAAESERAAGQLTGGAASRADISQCPTGLHTAADARSATTAAPARFAAATDTAAGTAADTSASGSERTCAGVSTGCARWCNGGAAKGATAGAAEGATATQGTAETSAAEAHARASAYSAIAAGARPFAC